MVTCSIGKQDSKKIKNVFKNELKLLILFYLLLYSSGSTTALVRPLDVEYIINILVSVYIICKYIDRQYCNCSCSGINLGSVN